jgi:hypothetical protein
VGGEVGAIGDILNKTKKQWEISGEETKELIEIRGKVKKKKKRSRGDKVMFSSIMSLSLIISCFRNF